MSDQISGEWFLRIAGIGGNLSDERVLHLLELIFDQNFDSHYGLLNATCPDGHPVSLDTYENCQTYNIWTGIAYTIASLAMTMGTPKTEEISHTILESIHENQLRCGRFWDHEESGPRYTRPLSSWTTLLAASGFTVDAANKLLRMTPYKDGVMVPFCTCDHLGTVQFNGDECVITLEEGSLEGWTVEVGTPEKPFTVKIQTA